MTEDSPQANPARLLLLEDSAADALLVERELARHWPLASTTRVQTAAQLQRALSEARWDAILSDYDMPGFSGPAALAACRALAPDTPFIVVSGKIGEESAVAMMKAGACDYVTKDRLSMLGPAIERGIREVATRGAHEDAQRTIREQAALIDLSPLAILELDLKGAIVSWNRGAEKTYGFPAREAIGAGYRQLFDAKASSFAAAFEEVLETGERRGESWNRRRDGRKIPVAGFWSLIERDGSTRILAYETDITDRKALEKQFLQAQRLESIGMMASGIAHDLNNIFLPIRMVAGLMKGRMDDEEGRKYLSILEGSITEGTVLTRQLLGFVRGEKGGGGQEPICSREILATIVKMIGVSFPKSISIMSDAPEAAWPVHGSATEIQQALLNLCINARDAMPQGGVLRLSVKNLAQGEGGAGDGLPGEAGGPQVVFSVSDTGSGIPAGIQEKIFDPFFTTKPVGQGTGLGLSTVLKIVEAHKGFVTVRSEDGKGATFRVHLPAAGTAPAAKRPPERFATRDERGAGTVLVVDDEKSIVQLVKGALESAGYRVLTASNGAEALHLFGERREEIGVVLLDYFMPVLDGPETVRALRRISDSVRIVYISGAESVVMGDRQEGVQGVLLKPFTLESLLRGVRGERG